MRSLLSTCVAASVLIVAPAAAQQTAPAPDADTKEETPKKTGIGIDGQFLLPLGDLGDLIGPQLGTLVRFGYRIIPALELTGRTGYLLGLTKASGPIKTSMTTFPLWLGARYFVLEPYAGLYGAAELALNLSSISTEFGGASASTSATRIGFNAGVGYVLSKLVPIDVRAQLTMYNLLLAEDTATAREPAYFAIGLSAGYTFQF